MDLRIDLVADLKNIIKKSSVGKVILWSNQGIIWVGFLLLLKGFLYSFNFTGKYFYTWRCHQVAIE